MHDQQHWFVCPDGMKRKDETMVGMRAGESVVMAPAGQWLVFGPEDLDAAAQLAAAITSSVVELRQRGVQDQWLRPWER